MANFKILLVEDEELYADKVEMLIDKLGYQHLGTADNSTDALSLIEKERPDLILMDVNIHGDYDGIELSELIYKAHGGIPIVFCTSMEDDMTFRRASRQNPVQMLIKPFSDIQLQRTIELCIQQLESKKDTKENAPLISNKTEGEWENDILFKEEFYIKLRQRLVKVAIKEVIFLEADGHYCQIHTAESKFLVRLSLNELKKRLPESSFFQTHRSYLVNIEAIKSVDLDDSVVIIGEKQVPLSKRNRESLLAKLDWI